MNGLLDNPVARHAGRLVTRRGWPAAVVALLALAAAVGALLGRFWMELPDYALIRPQMWSSWVGLTLLGETLVALPWAAVRGALLWRRLRSDGHLEEYRRSRMSPAAIVAGSIQAAVYPPLVLVGLSLLVSLLLAVRPGGLPADQVLGVHLLFLTQVLAFGALGLWVASRVRLPGLAIPLALGVLAAAIAAIWLLNPCYRWLAYPTAWIYAALLPNPVTAAGSVLDTDVLRFSWVYEQLHAHEYLFVYPPAWQTGGLYLLFLIGLCGLLARRLTREELRH